MAAMNTKRANQGKPWPRKVRHLWLGLAAVISTMLIQATAHAQTVKSADRISIDYGFVTQHYQTTWSDPTLPAGVARGMSPSARTSPIGNVTDDEGESPKLADSTNQPNSTETANGTNEAAVLYAIDLGEDGMTTVVSTKTSLQPGNCVAIERSGTYFNLRGVNAGFCDPNNQATIADLQSVNLAAARRCMLARAPLEAKTFDENQTLTASEIGMLCDGS